MTLSEFATTTNDSASMTSYERIRTSISMSSLQRHQKRIRSIRYTFAINIIRRWIFYLHTNDTRAMTWNEKLKNINFVTSVLRRHCRRAGRNTWLGPWHPQALHKAFRPPPVHTLSSLVLESSFNEYRLPRTAVTLF